MLAASCQYQGVGGCAPGSRVVRVTTPGLSESKGTVKRAGRDIVFGNLQKQAFDALPGAKTENAPNHGNSVVSYGVSAQLNRGVLVCLDDKGAG